MQSKRKIAVAGATGRVGRHVVDVLTERGHEAVAMSRATGVGPVTDEVCREYIKHMEALICGGMLNGRMVSSE